MSERQMTHLNSTEIFNDELEALKQRAIAADALYKSVITELREAEAAKERAEQSLDLAKREIERLKSEGIMGQGVKG